MLSGSYAQLVLEELQNRAPKSYLEGNNYFNLGNLLLGMGTCQIAIKASNYTYPHTQTTIGTITATQTLPTTSYSKYEIIQLLSEIIQPLFEIIQPLSEIIQLLPEIIQPLSEIIQLLSEIMQPLFEIIQSLFEIIQPLFDIIQPLSEILQPLPEIMQSLKLYYY